MTSTNIYTSIDPTYLYIKQHFITGLKYFGKTTKDPYKYIGSGKYWNNHIKKHGKEHIDTLWVSELYHDTSIVEPALHFSEENNIVKSKDWVNLIYENGLDGGSFGIIVSNETKAKMSESRKGKTNSEETRSKISAATKGKIVSEETRVKISEANKGRSPSDKARTNQSIAQQGRIVSEETRAKISKALKGKPLTEERKAKISDTLKGKTKIW